MRSDWVAVTCIAGGAALALGVTAALARDDDRARHRVVERSDERACVVGETTVVVGSSGPVTIRRDRSRDGEVVVTSVRGVTLRRDGRGHDHGERRDATCTRIVVNGSGALVAESRALRIPSRELRLDVERMRARAERDRARYERDRERMERDRERAEARAQVVLERARAARARAQEVAERRAEEAVRQAETRADAAALLAEETRERARLSQIELLERQIERLDARDLEPAMEARIRAELERRLAAVRTGTGGR